MGRHFLVSFILIFFIAQAQAQLLKKEKLKKGKKNLTVEVAQPQAKALPQTQLQTQLLKKETLKIGKHILTVEVAQSEVDRNKGLMNRMKLEKNEGMLFIFEQEQILHFWMKNTFIALSIGFFDKHRKLIEILDMRPVKTMLDKNIPRYSSRKPSRFALEVNKGWFKANGIKIGQRFQFINALNQKSKLNK